MARHAVITGTGRYLPEREVTNDELRQRFAHLPEFVDKMEASTAIRTRWKAPDDWATSDLATEAARRALAKAGKRPEDVDMIILGTDSPDYVTPATSVVVQHKLGAKHAGTFDVVCACASFPTGLASATGLIATNPSIRTVVVIGVYMMQRLADPADPTIFFYGDGAGAAVVEAHEAPGFLGAAFQADGAYAKHWLIASGGTVEPATEESVRAGRTKVRLVERYPPEINHEGWPRLVRTLAANVGFAVADIDFVIFTQVRQPSIELVMGDLGLPMDRTFTNMDRCGYTGSACIPIALDEAIERGHLKAGQLVVFVGSGVGYNQAAAAFRWV
ncbi:MAG: ketoacyl-ACP synthase III [Vicinamibacterales bacterium]|nr:ketoacyl-ACP synthase III [Vicinamibacterales bacterium]